MKARRRNAMPLHERFGKRLARFKARGGGGRAEEAKAGVGEMIGDAEAQEKLGADDGEIDFLARREHSEAGDVLEIGRDRANQPCNSRIPGRATYAFGASLRCQTHHERVLARAAAENENPHELSRLWLGSISLTSTGFAPRIRRCV